MKLTAQVFASGGCTALAVWRCLGEYNGLGGPCWDASGNG